VLTITPTAADAIKEITRTLPDVAGVRLSTVADLSMNGHAPPPVLDVALSPAPGDDDAVIEEDGAQVFFEPSLAGFLEDKVLDVGPDDDQIRFVLSPQDE
jgi:Fe-S cluster assembly iron-binding protein IscA